jgi:Bifunctional DNA primase/polymerase, N-terminal
MSASRKQVTENKMGLFSRWQPHYAAHNIATFPVLITAKAKRPAVTNYGKVGLPGSAELAGKRQFADANAFGFMTGPRSNITVLDVDTTDEQILADALIRHGPTQFVIRSASGKFHAYYRNNGERRRIRPWRGLPIDVLGAGGYVVAPPSKSAKGQYEIIQGGLDDLERLPVMRNLDLSKPEGAKDGERGQELFEHLMRAAHHVDCFDDLLDVGRTFADNCEPPMEDARVISTAQSVWGYTQRGENRFGRHGAWFPLDEVNSFIVDQTADQDAFWLLGFLRAHQGPDATFMCANGLGEKFGWHRIRLANARRRLIEFGYFKPVRNAGRGSPAMFRWAPKRPLAMKH